MIAGTAFSFWLGDRATAKFKSTPHFTGPFSFFKTPIGKSIDKVVSVASQSNSLSEDVPETHEPIDARRLLYVATAAMP